MANDLGSDLDQLPPQRGQRPMLHFLGQRQGPHEVGEVVGQGVKLEANLVVAELAARQPRPFDGLLAFLDELLRRATVIVKRHNPVGLAAQVGDDEADAGAQLAGMPFDLGNDAAFLVPRSGLIAEAGVITPHMVRWTANGAGQQMSNALLKNGVRLEADGVEEALGFQKLVDVRRSECRVATKIKPNLPFLVAVHHRLQNSTPTIGAVNITGTQGASFQITELVEQE